MTAHGVTLHLGGLAAAQASAKRFRSGGEVGTLYPPKRNDAGLWVVTVEGADVLGEPERREKVFNTETKAMDFYTELWLGMSRTEAAVAASDGLLPGRDRGDPNPRKQLKPVSPCQVPRRSTRSGGTALRKVAEVLASYDMDPSVELAEILTPVPVVDPDTGVTYEQHRLPPQARASVLLELMQYAHPKLKAVEMKIEGTLAGLTQEQIDAQLAALLAKAGLTKDQLAALLKKAQPPTTETTP